MRNIMENSEENTIVCLYWELKGKRHSKSHIYLIHVLLYQRILPQEKKLKMKLPQHALPKLLGM